MMVPLWLWVLAGALVLGSLLHSRSGRYQRDIRRLPVWACVCLVLVGVALVVLWAFVSGQLTQL